MAQELGKVLVIANPLAHSGEGKKDAYEAMHFLERYSSTYESLDFVFTSAAGDAQQIARDAQGKDSIIVVGGDGVIHEVANGLMCHEASVRPALGLVPVGTGNDYARTLGVSRNDVYAALTEIIRGKRKRVDVGKVNDVYFVETCSFGLDAAIAHDTSRRRAEGDTTKGTSLFVSSAVKILPLASKRWHCKASFDGQELEFDESLLAFQVGPSYGAGFRVCPYADPCDSYLDVFRNTGLPSPPTLVFLLGLARFGLHGFSRHTEFRKIKHACLSFDEEPPAQTDGELLVGREFDIEIVPSALDVLVSDEL